MLLDDDLVCGEKYNRVGRYGYLPGKCAPFLIDFTLIFRLEHTLKGLGVEAVSRLHLPRELI